MNKKVTIIITFGILIIIVLYSFSRLISSNKLEYYNKIEKEMIIASKNYFLDYSNYLPKEINDNTRVLLSALVIEKYIDKIKDVNNKDCSMTKSYVEVKKISDKKYLYKTHLVCDKDSYKTKDGE